MPKPRKYPKAHAKIARYLETVSQREAQKFTKINQATWSLLVRELVNPTEKTKSRLRKIGVTKGDWS
jgi:hypothetical protein